MIVIKATLVLFLLYDSASSQTPSQEECMNAQADLNSNPDCYSAFVAENTTRSTLEAYCTQRCRRIIERVIECGNESSDAITVEVTAAEIVDLTCLVNGDGQSCAEFLETLQDSVSSCISFGACIPGCETILRNAVDEAGCCYYPLINAFGELAATGAPTLLGICGVVPPSQQVTCQTVGGSFATGLKAIGFGIILCVAAVTSLL